MTSKQHQEKPVGVLGGGSFGTAVANLLANNTDVIFYVRHKSDVEEIVKTRNRKGYPIHERITPTSDLKLVIEECDIIFPVVPSHAFRNLMQQMAPYLRPSHILIHGTKGLDISLPKGTNLDDFKSLGRDQVKTMTEVILDETSVIRVGCLAGPNLAKELSDGQPAATVVASQFEEVINAGIKYLRNDRFMVYGNSDLIGIELAGVLKNIIAIASGILSGLGYGENAKGLLISRGMIEILYLGTAMGGNMKAFLGLAGIGDLVATSNSTFSRNFTVGYRLAKGESLAEILQNMEEVAEGVNTIKIVVKLAEKYQVKAPITQILNRVLFSDLDPREGLQYLMKFPINVDVEFLNKLNSDLL